MAEFIAYLIAGIATGAIYALAAIGFTLVWQTSQTINFAQGEFVMLPAFVMLAFGAVGLPLPVAFIASCVVAVVVLGWAFKRGIADPLRPVGDSRECAPLREQRADTVIAMDGERGAAIVGADIGERCRLTVQHDPSACAESRVHRAVKRQPRQTHQIAGAGFDLASQQYLAVAL